jgi:oligopeptide transport system ATP-binding protein
MSRDMWRAGPEDDGPLLDVRDLSVHFPIKRGLILQKEVGAVRAVDRVSFTIARGEALGLVGESGSGKTTTGRAILRLVTPTAGSILYKGRPLDVSKGERKQLRRDIQMVFQSPLSSLNPRMTVGNSIGDPLRVHGIGDRGEREKTVRALMEKVGLNPAWINRYPHQFSGGQRQRIGIARALSVSPMLIVADEPVSALDVSIQSQILNLLTDLQRDLGLTYLIISHDLAVVRHLCGRVAVMYLGRIMEIGDRDRIYARPRHPYTRALLSAVHVPDPIAERSRSHVPLPGEIPSPSEPIVGCRFRSRCYLYEALGRPDRCAAEEPELRTVEDGQSVACHFAEQTTALDRPALKPSEKDRIVEMPLIKSQAGFA